MNTRTHSRLLPLILACLLAALGALLPAIVSGQAHTLHVTLRDVSGAGVAGVTIVLRGEDGQELTRQPTDGAGTASFDNLPAVVRVAVDGQPRGGPPLYQLGADTKGVRVMLSGGDPVMLDLRAERDGLVLPDPETEVVREEGGPLADNVSPIPTAILTAPPTGASQLILDSQLAQGDKRAPGEVTVDERATAGLQRPWLALLILAFGLGAILLVRRWRDAR